MTKKSNTTKRDRVSPPRGAPAKTWRAVLPIHPAADLFPLMAKTDPAALKVLADDIKKNHLQSPIMLGGNRKTLFLIDGRNRLDALELLGFNLVAKNGRFDETLGLFSTKLISRSQAFRLAAAVVNYADPKLTDAEITALVVSLNIHRRHLTTEQKRDLVTELVKLYPEKSDRALAADLKVDKNVVSRARKKVAATGAGAPVEKRTGKDGKSRRMPAKKPKTAAANSAAPSVAPSAPLSPAEQPMKTAIAAAAAQITNIGPPLPDSIADNADPLAIPDYLRRHPTEIETKPAPPGDNGEKVRELERLLGAARSEIGDLEIALRAARGDPTDIALTVISSTTPNKDIADRLMKVLTWDVSNDVANYLLAASKSAAAENRRCERRAAKSKAASKKAAV